MDAPDALIEFLAPYPPHVRDAMLEGREILIELLDNPSELVFDATSAVCDGFAYTADVKGCFVNLAAYSNHATLVFGHGAALDDPLERLKGEGKQVRHLRMKGAEDLRDPYVRDLILQAERNAPRPDLPKPATLVVKVYAGPKRRPA